MKLKDLLAGVDIIDVNIPLNTEVKHICAHSDECKNGSLFFAMRGDSNDGNNYIHDALAKGCVAVVTQSSQSDIVPHIVVGDIRIAVGIIASNFYRKPHKKLKIVTVVGTNGKTTTANIIAHILTTAGKRVAVIGTLGAQIGERELPCNLTTPDPIDLHRLFCDAVEAGCEYAVIEVSAHAIHYNKTYGIIAEAAVFTNLSQDHLDFFGTMQQYADTKLAYFKGKNFKTAIVNTDDEMGLTISRSVQTSIKTYGLKTPSDTFAIDIVYRNNGTSFIVNSDDSIFEVKTKLIGEFNVYNSLAAIAACRFLGINIDRIIMAFMKLEPIKGRFNVLESGKKVIIDFAHTPDGLRNLLKAARKLCSGRLIAVFGCGGNRDTKKRPIMGKIAAEYADFIVITSDNSRDENPEDIIMQIEQGVQEVTSDYITIADRERAITYAIITASQQDLVVIAGKGGEEYMEVKGIKTPYSDKKIVEGIFRRYRP